MQAGTMQNTTNPTVDGATTPDCTVGIVATLIVTTLIHVLIWIIIVLCLKWQQCFKFRSQVQATCGRAMKYMREPQRTNTLTRSDVNSSTALPTAMEMRENEYLGDTRFRTQSTISQKNEAYGVVAQLNEDRNKESEEQRFKRQSTVSQQNEAYGIVEQLKKEGTGLQHNTTYEMVDNTSAVTKGEAQKESGSQNDEYDYVKM